MCLRVASVIKLTSEGWTPTEIYAKRRRTGIKTPKSGDGQNNSDREENDRIVHLFPPDDCEECDIGRTNSQGRVGNKQANRECPREQRPFHCDCNQARIDRYRSRPRPRIVSPVGLRLLLEGFGDEAVRSLASCGCEDRQRFVRSFLDREHHRAVGVDIEWDLVPSGGF